MPAIAVYAPVSSWPTVSGPDDRRSQRPNPAGRDSHPRVEIVAEGPPPTPQRIRLPVAPNEIDNSGHAPDYTEVGANARQPNLVRGAESLHRIRLPLLLVWRDPDRDPERQYAELRALARDRWRVRITYGPSEQGWWRITDLSVAVKTRMQENRIGEATATIELTRAWHPDPSLTPPVEQAVQAPVASPPPAATPAATPRTVTVKQGDTLYAVAGATLSDGARWPEIASLNGITDPRKLQVGAVLKIPA